MKLLKKRAKLLILIAIILCITLPISIVYQYVYYPSFAFSSLKTELFHELYAGDGLSIQFSFADQSAFLDDAPYRLPCFYQAAYETDTCQDYADRLKKINPEKLSQSDQNLYHRMLSYFSLHNRDKDYLYLENPFRPTGGLQTQLPILLAQFPIQDAQDVEQYFCILEDIPSYFSSYVEYMKIRKAKGITTSTGDLDEAIHQCDEMKGPKGKALFYDSFSALIEDEALSFSVSQKELYLSRCDTLLDSYVLPAYKQLADALYILKDEMTGRKGLCRQQKADYYAILLQEQTGSSKTLPQIEALLKKRFETLYPKWQYEYALLSKTDLSKLEFDLSAEPQTILLQLQDYMQDQFPTLETDISYDIKTVPNALSAYCAPAYYFTPRIDSYLENTIYVNHPELCTCADLFTTLAHEGYPGHMLQSTYFFHNNGLSVMDTALYQAFANVGYVEGWALYTELLSYDYLSTSDCIKDETKAHYYKALQLQRELMICLYCMLDIRVHIYGDEADDLLPYLARLGLDDKKLAQNLFIYLVNEPTTYASYYVGYLELLELKDFYIASCDDTGRAYSAKEFHRFLLSCGPISFDEIKQKMQTDF